MPSPTGPSIDGNVSPAIKPDESAGPSISSSLPAQAATDQDLEAPPAVGEPVRLAEETSVEVRLLVRTTQSVPRRVTTLTELDPDGYVVIGDDVAVLAELIDRSLTIPRNTIVRVTEV
ncbi:MAG: hypothetical protein M3Y77_10805 [Actinomycetota bacterium]|nr:hypothetical protein [Actinomycetota bacterium]